MILEENPLGGQPTINVGAGVPAVAIAT